jgi:glycosyltransferase involved in cell wall biosynthesis
MKEPYNRHIGVFSDFLPRPDTSSSNLRVYEIAYSLVDAGYTVHYFWWLSTGEDAAYLNRFADSIRFHFIDRNCDAIVNSVFEHQLNLVWFTNLWGVDWLNCTNEAARKIRDLNSEISIIADTMDYHAKKYYRKFKCTGDKADRVLADAFFDAENGLYRAVDGVVAVTNAEARDISRVFNVDTAMHVVGNIHTISPSTVAFDERKDFVFLGNYRVPHNVDALCWFLEFIQPKLEQLLPGARLYLIGKYAEELHCDIIKHPAVFVVGFVEDLPAQLEKYRVMIVPLTYGAGMKGKIGSGAACGLPLVATSIGAEGYPFITERYTFIADRPDDFAECCVRMHTDRDLWVTMSVNLLDMMSNTFSRRKIISGLLEMTSGYNKRQPIPSEKFTGITICRSLQEFVKIMSTTERGNRVVVLEPTLSHQETFHALIEYFNTIGFGVDFILRSETRDSRDTLETLADAVDIDAAFFYVLNPKTVGACISSLNSSNHHAIFFNTLFEYWLNDGLMDSPHWERLDVPNRYAYVHHRTKFEQSTIQYPIIPDSNLFALSESISVKCGALLLSPSYFYDMPVTELEDDQLVRFVCVGGTGDRRRDYSQLLDACILLNENGYAEKYQVDIIGGDYTTDGDWSRKYGANIRRYKLENNIRLHGEQSFKKLFSLVRRSDYLLFLINMCTPYSREYLRDKITGSMSLSLGFGVVPVLDEKLSDNWGLGQCAVNYKGYRGFLGAILDAVQRQIPQQDLQRTLKEKNAWLRAVSGDNLKTRLCQG